MIVAGKNPVAGHLDELVKKLRDFAGASRARIGAPLELEVLGHLKGLFNAIETQELPQLNQQLEAAGLPKLTLTASDSSR